MAQDNSIRVRIEKSLVTVVEQRSNGRGDSNIYKETFEMLDKRFKTICSDGADGAMAIQFSLNERRFIQLNLAIYTHGCIQTSRYDSVV